MRVLVACEESQTVCKAFRERGHEAYSCDILDCSGGHPEWHIKWDALALINGGCSFVTCDGGKREVPEVFYGSGRRPETIVGGVSRILQSSIRERDRRVGAKGIRGEQEAWNDGCYASAGAY